MTSVTNTALATNNYKNPVTEELCKSLSASPKTISPKYFYNRTGSELFEQITQLPEYYPTRTEVGILQNNAHAIADLLGDNVYLIEPGAGNCSKVRHLLNAIRPDCYLPMDISAEFLFHSAQQLREDFDWLRLHPIAADFTEEFNLPDLPMDANKVVFYPGSTIGNFEPDAAVQFLSHTKEVIGQGGGILIGIDLQKDHNLLNAAYNDTSGITELFNLNVLNNINNLTDSNFNPNKFSHHAFYNDKHHRIEMHLVCEQPHQVMIEDTVIEFEKGESIHTENSYKYTLEGIAELANSSGLTLRQSWTDSDQLFSVNLLTSS